MGCSVIHYHGTPISGDGIDAAKFLKGRHALVSFAYQQSMPIVANACQSFVLDNGAFSAWTKGFTMDVKGYIYWVEKWHKHPGFDWALIPDVIDGDENANDELIDRWPKSMRGVPVWHLHESMERLQRLASEWSVVAIGSSGQWKSPGTDAWWARMALVMDAVCDDLGRPMCRLHGLRMLDPKIFSELPLSSADSTNAGVNAGSIKRFGMYPPPTAGQRAEVIASRIEASNSSAVWVKSDQIEMAM